jgi:crotonobetainyl-CoA:carnitine CoA-transferase CaiB-like acyl-CoA transferase
LSSNNLRVLARHWLIPLLRERLANTPASELASLFEANGLPFAPITDPQHLFEDPHLNATGGLAPMTLPDGRETRVPLLPLKLDGERLALRLDPPKLDEHGTELMRSLGYSADEVAALRRDGILLPDSGLAESDGISRGLTQSAPQFHSADGQLGAGKSSGGQA